MTSEGRLVAAAIRVIGIEDVLLARITPGPRFNLPDRRILFLFANPSFSQKAREALLNPLHAVVEKCVGDVVQDDGDFVHGSHLGNPCTHLAGADDTYLLDHDFPP
jgi:hypothetical protein